MKQRHDDPQFKLRIPAALKAQLEDCARKNNRSLSAEILQRLEDSLSVNQIFSDDNQPSEFSLITDELNVLSSAIRHEESVLETMLANHAGIKSGNTEGALEFQKIRIQALRANYLSLIERAGLKVNPENIFQLIWD
ncbi:Arc family DNA-binding protein [Acetobacter indonesiensis]|uniref:Arc family DNA-binding protein n=1 Tax=Acetobacter indonesiensis TaxID=104101 RepID=UPI0039E74117